MSANAYALMPLDNHMTQSDPLAADASFQFVDVRNLGMIDSLPKHTPHGVVTDLQWFCGPTMIFWADACTTQYEFIVVNGHTMTSMT